MRCSVTGEIDTPYIGGFDSDAFCSLMKQWFKRDGLLDYFKRSYNAEQFKKECYDKESDIADYTISNAQAATLISFLEEKIREDLHEHASDLEKSREAVETFIEGMEYALRTQSFKPKSITLDGC